MDHPKDVKKNTDKQNVSNEQSHQEKVDKNNHKKKSEYKQEQILQKKSDKDCTQQFQQEQSDIMNMKINNKKTPKKIYFKTTQSGEAYLHFQGSNVLKKIQLNKLLFSQVIRSYSDFTLNLIEEQKNWWVVLPAYLHKNSDDTNQQQNYPPISDVQLVLTGKIKLSEDPIDATIRQAKEQIGLDVEEQDIIGLGKNGEMKAVPDSRGNRNQVYPSIIKLHQIKEPLLQEKKSKIQVSDLRQSIQSWLLIKNPQDQNFLKRKRCISEDDAGQVVVLIKAYKLKKILNQFKENEMWTNKKQINTQRPSNKYLSQNESDPVLGDLKQLQKLKFRSVKQSKKTQEEISQMSPQEITQFIDYIQDYIGALLSRWPAYFIVLALFKKSNKQQRGRIIKLMCQKLHRIITYEVGVSSCQNLLQYVNRYQWQDCIKLLFDTIFPNFIQLSKNEWGFHLIRKIVKEIQIQRLLKLNQYIEDVGIFQDLAANRYSIFVMEQIFQRVQKESLKKNQKAKQMKKKIIQQLCLSLGHLIQVRIAHYLIRMAYELLTPKQMNKITKRIFKNFKFLSNQQNSQHILNECINFLWIKPQYSEYYKQLANTLKNQDIQQLYDAQPGNRVLRSLLRLEGQFQIKYKIMNIVMDKPAIISKGRWNFSKMQIRQQYEKIDDKWVLKK